MVVGDCKRGVSGETGYPAIFYQTAIMVDAGWCRGEHTFRRGTGFDVRDGRQFHEREFSVVRNADE